MQQSGTCWFNSSLNGFVLADGTGKLIYDQIQKLSPTEIASLAKSFPEDSCPITLSKKYIYHYFLKIHNRERIDGGSGNNAVDLIGKIYTPGKLATTKGGYPKIAAEQILNRLFSNSEVGKLSKWETVCPNDFSKCTLIYRDGHWKENTTPSTHPMVIKTIDGKTRFKLSHMVIASFYHVITAYVCGDKKYIYNSNFAPENLPGVDLGPGTRLYTGRMEVDWSNKKNEKKIIHYLGATEIRYISYTLYVRE